MTDSRYMPWYGEALTEKSLLETIEAIKVRKGCVTIRPDKVIVPPWAAREIISEYGELTIENFHKWNIHRCKLTIKEYRKIFP